LWPEEDGEEGGEKEEKEGEEAPDLAGASIFLSLFFFSFLLFPLILRYPGALGRDGNFTNINTYGE
jgi:hypothetical protein